jgi:hypothetical protein
MIGCNFILSALLVDENILSYMIKTFNKTFIEPIKEKIRIIKIKKRI